MSDVEMIMPVPKDRGLYLTYSLENTFLGNYQEALDDATVSVQLEPTFIKAIETGKFFAFPKVCRSFFRFYYLLLMTVGLYYKPSDHAGKKLVLRVNIVLLNH